MLLVSLGLLEMQCSPRCNQETIQQEPPGSILRPCEWHAVEVWGCPDSRAGLSGYFVLMGDDLWTALLDNDAASKELGMGIRGLQGVAVVKSRPLPRPREVSSRWPNMCGETISIQQDILELHPVGVPFLDAIRSRDMSSQDFSRDYRENQMAIARQEVERRCRLDRRPAP